MGRKDRETRRRGREQKRKARGTSWMCEEFGHDWQRALYKSGKQPPGIVIQECKNCPKERAVRVPRY